MLANPKGTAPGYFVPVGPGGVAVLPGPPRENQPMVQSTLRDVVRACRPGAPERVTRLLRVFGLPESEVNQLTIRFAAAESSSNLTIYFANYKENGRDNGDSFGMYYSNYFL